MWTRTEAAIAMAAMLLLANSSSCAAAVSGGNVTYGGGGFVMTEEMELEMLIEDLYFSVHVSRVLAGNGPPGKGTDGSGNRNKQACKGENQYDCDPKASEKDNGGERSVYDRNKRKAPGQ